MNTTNKVDMIFLVAVEIQEIIDGFLLDRKAKKRSPNTIKYYQEQLGYFHRWLSAKGITIIDQVTTNVLREFFIELGTHRNKGGVHAAYRSIKSMLSWYKEEYDLDDWKNPMRKIQISPNRIEPLPGISIPDVQKLLQACYGQFEIRDTAILHTLVNTGCRAIELANLCVGDVNLITGSIVIRHGKGDKRRTVWIGSDGRKAIRKYLKTRDILKTTSPLFLSEFGRKFTYNGLKSMIDRLAERAGITSPGLHDFRRCFALTLYRKKIDLLTISRLLGHSELSTTRRYLAVDDEDLRNVILEVNPFEELG